MVKWFVEYLTNFARLGSDVDKVLSEYYIIVMAMDEKYINRIPVDIWYDIITKKNGDYIFFIDENRELGEQGLA